MFDKRQSLKVKGVAILMLVFHHLFYNPKLVQQSGMKFLFFPYEWGQLVAVAARICVWIFVFLSAYGLEYQYQAHKNEESTLQFIIKRWISLMKNFWIVFIVAMIIYAVKLGNPLAAYGYHLYRCFLDFMGWSDFFHFQTMSAVWWYMCFAQILIIVIPLLDIVCEKFGLAAFLIAFIALQYLPAGIYSEYGGRYTIYLMSAMLGVYCAKTGFLNRILSREGKFKIVKAVVLFTVSVGLIVMKHCIKPKDEWLLTTLISAVAAFLIVILVSKYFTNAIVEKILIFLGKHSGNIFMMHKLIYIYATRCIIFSHIAVICYILLVAASIVFSICIEFVKKKIHYNEFFDKVTKRIIRIF